MSKIKNIRYVSTIRGVTEHKTGQSTVYYGLTFRIKREDYATDRQMELEDEIFSKIEQWIQSPPQGEGAFAKGGTVERYEVFDAESGDVLVMYRVPFQGSPFGAKSPPRDKPRGGGYVN